MSSKSQTRVLLVSAAILILALLSACGGTPSPVSVVNTAVPQLAAETVEPEIHSAPTQAVTEAVANPVVPQPAGPGSEIVVYASDLSQSALSELGFIDDSASPGGKLIGLPNTGDELDPPPENDPHISFSVQVQSGIPYRCWIHLKVGEAKGRSTANIVWVQFSDSVNQANQEVFRFGTNSYLTAQGPTALGWTWVACDAAGSDSLVYFSNRGEVTVRIQAGAEGVGFDQFILSPVKFLNSPPPDAIVAK